MKKFDVDREDVMKFAGGQWVDIFNSLAPGLSEAADQSNGSTHSTCPFPERHVNSGGVKKFRLWSSNSPDYNGSAICTCGKWSNGISLLMDVNGLSFTETLEEINSFLGDPCGAEGKRLLQDSTVPDEVKLKRKQEIALNRKEREEAAVKNSAARQKKQASLDAFFVTSLRETWMETVPVLDNLAQPLWRYLKNRGIALSVLESLSDDIHFHPSLPHYMGGERLGEYPAMLCLVRDKLGDPVSIHRTYLTNDGEKATLPADEKAKQMMPSPSYVDLSGGAIQLTGKKAVLGLSEGIETALAVIDATGLPTWPTYSDSMLANFDLEKIKGDVDLVLIWADKDRSLAGEKAAKTLKQRAWDAGIACQIMLPCFPIPEGEKSIDWLDVLNLMGKDAFPRPDVERAVEMLRTA